MRSVTITNVQPPGHAAQHLLREPQHRQALARRPACARRRRAACRRPRGSARRSSIAALTPKYWWLRASDLDQPARPLACRRRSSRRGRAAAPARRCRGSPSPARPRPRVPVGVDRPSSRRRTPTARTSRRPCASEPFERITNAFGTEELRDRVAVVGEVLVVGRLDRPVRLLELRQHQRDAVDEQHEVDAPRVEVAGDPHLVRGQPVVARRVAPVEVARSAPSARSPSLVAPLGPVAVAQQVVDLAVRPRRVQQRAVARERSGGLLERRVRRLRVQRAQRRAAGDARGRRRDGCSRPSVPPGPSISSNALTVSQPSSARSSTRGRSTSSSSENRSGLTPPALRGARRGRASRRRSAPVTSFGRRRSRMRRERVDLVEQSSRPCSSMGSTDCRERSARLRRRYGRPARCARQSRSCDRSMPSPLARRDSSSSLRSTHDAVTARSQLLGRQAGSTDAGRARIAVDRRNADLPKSAASSPNRRRRLGRQSFVPTRAAVVPCSTRHRSTPSVSRRRSE